ncbi:hypothetical protein EJ02DRAFT_395814 [Clathrospora elynae]|uniref:LITAF domain-containing protein n=1 Tax=Clathrospora elynae TaxID=706981 RepID=A0A6A5T0U5_9PLEO|nr:hypothetical protein EJ02DRAFT_395814 [Clathrospora elynae]
MGVPTAPQEAAPAYDDVFSDHPVNRHMPSGSTSAYNAVPQEDDLELHAHDHNHTPSTVPDQGPDTFAPKPQPHVHCEQCDIQLAARQRSENEKYCCTMVASVFMTLFVCGMLMGIVIINAVTEKGHGL